jgi:two-component system, NtrC family, response regulator AtoC
MHTTRPRPRILVVDDDLGSRTLTAIVLTEAGYSPLCVATAARALEVLGSDQADLLLTDLVMPGVGGVDLLRILQTWSDPPPVVAVTASDDDSLIAAALRHGAIAVLRKPVSIDMLSAAVEDALGHRRAA